jgi:hypothetical protein
MASTKLSIANGVLRLLKEGMLTQSELTNNTRESARLFNAVWSDGAVNGALEAGQWKFARRTVQLDAATDVEADFGLRYAFTKPDDFVRTIGQWSDEMMQCPLMDVREEAGYWWSSQLTWYLSYVSNDPQYGNNYGLWPQSFLEFAQAHIASKMAGPLTSQGKEILQLRKMLLRQALSTDAMADPTKFPPVGSWARARGGSGPQGRERGGPWM